MANSSQRESSKEQILYASILEKGMLLGLALMFITFILYAFEFVSPAVPLDRLPEYWSMSVTEYLNAIDRDYLHFGHTTTGWTWIYLLSYGDFMNFFGIALLAGITIICYIVVIPILWSNKDRAYTYMAVAEVAVLVLAASGILKGGH